MCGPRGKGGKKNRPSGKDMLGVETSKKGGSPCYLHHEEKGVFATD